VSDPKAAARRVRFDTKLALLAAAAVVAVSFVLVMMASILSGSYNALAKKEVDALIRNDLMHVVTGVYNLVSAEDMATDELLSSHLAVLKREEGIHGGFVLEKETVAWKARNQLTGAVENWRLPRMSVGGDWLGQNRDSAVPTPLVDAVAGFVGATATIFQRANEAGDMLRIATSVLDSDGHRAIGTFIPAVSEDGTANPVIQTVLKGGVYRGRAYVVNAWYLTVYEPLTDESGAVIGMLYVGIPQGVAESRIRQAILGTELGSSGYVWVVSATGGDQGRYVISRKGERDGEYIWDVVDDEGRYAIRELVAAASALGKSEIGSYRYRWKNPGELEYRWKTALLMHYQPWNWVIGAGIYDDESRVYAATLDAGRGRMVGVLAVAGGLLAAFIAMAGFLFAVSLSRPLRRITLAAQAFADGRSFPAIEAGANDDIGVLARAFNDMAERVRSSLDVLRRREEKFRDIYENAMEGMFLTTLDGTFLEANTSLARILGYPSAAALMDQVRNIGNQLYRRPEDRAAVVGELLEHGAVFDAELQFRKADGTFVWVSLSARYVPEQADGPAHLAGFITDISRRREAEDTLRSLLAEKDSLLKEVHHRVRNNLQLMTSILDLQTGIVTTEESAAALGSFKRRVLTISLVHDLMFRQENITDIDFGDYIRRLSDQVVDLCPGGALVHATVRSDGLRLPLELAVPCGIAVSELVANVYTHAYPPDWKGNRSLDIDLGRGSDGFFIEVKDAGRGLPAGADLFESGGLGLQLISASVAQAGGQVKPLPRDRGTAVRLQFPGAIVSDEK